MLNRSNSSVTTGADPFGKLKFFFYWKYWTVDWSRKNLTSSAQVAVLLSVSIFLSAPSISCNLIIPTCSCFFMTYSIPSLKLVYVIISPIISHCYKVSEFSYLWIYNKQAYYPNFRYLCGENLFIILHYRQFFVYSLIIFFYL